MVRKKIIIFFIALFLGISLSVNADFNLYNFDDIRQELGMRKSNTLPTSPFYFMKEFRRGLQNLFTFSSMKKANLAIKFFDERMSEIISLKEREPRNKPL